jgi:hypothetical protein
MEGGKEGGKEQGGDSKKGVRGKVITFPELMCCMLSLTLASSIYNKQQQIGHICWKPVASETNFWPEGGRVGGR